MSRREALTGEKIAVPLDYDAMLRHRFADVSQSYAATDAILYALGVGCGAGEADLDYVHGPRQKTLPTLAAVLGSPGFWPQQQSFGVDWRLILHGEQSISWHRPLASSGHVTGRYALTEVVDRGAGGHALVRGRRQLFDDDGQKPLATLWESWVFREAGGFGGPGGSLTATRANEPLPDRPADVQHDIALSPRAGLIYRLSGDFNPLHADPAVAAAAGYDRPILHGLCTMGTVSRHILALFADDDPSRLREMGQRFTAVVYPGDLLRLEAWRADDGIRFRIGVPARGSTVLDRGWAVIG